MLLRRSFLAIGRRVATKPIVPIAPRTFSTSVVRRKLFALALFQSYFASQDAKCNCYEQEQWNTEIQSQASQIKRWFLSKVLDTSPIPPLLSQRALISSTEIRTEEDLLPPGAEPGTVPTDLDQSTGLERFEILGKMQGVDVFDMKPLDASRKGTEIASTTVKSFIILDETTLVGTTMCVCGMKTWRGCAGGGWCWGERTWRKEGTKTEKELRKWKFRTMIGEELKENWKV